MRLGEAWFILLSLNLKKVTVRIGNIGGSGVSEEPPWAVGSR